MPSGGMPAESTAQRFRMGDMPPLTEGFTERPDTARGIVEALVPGATLALVPGSAFSEGPSNWLGTCGKTQLAVIIAESLWRARPGRGRGRVLAPPPGPRAAGF